MKLTTSFCCYMALVFTQWRCL